MINRPGTPWWTGTPHWCGPSAAGTGWAALTPDVSQNVWLQLADQLDSLRDLGAVAGWLATTTWRECARFCRAAQRPAYAPMPDAGNVPDDQCADAADEVLAAEWNAALREAFTHLPLCCQRLLALLTEDPPIPYAQISAKLGMPVGSIGPSCGRCLEKLRCHPAIAALINPEAQKAAELTILHRSARRQIRA